MSRFTKRNAARAAALALTVASLGTVAATAASASTTHGTVSATTKIVTRFDGGGGGNWAYDGTRAAPMTRTVTLTLLGRGGPAGTPDQYMATVTDKGGFQTIPGALAPNQGGHYAGQVMRPTQETGKMSGFAEYTFDASARANSPRTFANLGVPIALHGTTQNGLYPTSTWPENAFPAGTTFAGLNLYDWGWTYTVPASTSGGHVHRAQTWNDTLGNGGGQYRADGQIR